MSRGPQVLKGNMSGTRCGIKPALRAADSICFGCPIFRMPLSAFHLLLKHQAILVRLLFYQAQ